MNPSIKALYNFRYQDVFAHETIIEKPIYKSTNLVCSIPEGEKYNAAVRCKIPVVTANWLIACAVQSRWVDETPFLVVKSLGIQLLNKFILYMYIQKFL